MAFALRPVFAGLIALLTASLANAAVFTDASQLPDTVYDFVVVGGALPSQIQEPELISSIRKFNSRDRW